jgi:hypothetical protein
VAGYGVAGYYAMQAYELYEEISKFFGNAEDMIKAIAATIGSVKAELAVRDLPTVQPYHHPAGPDRTLCGQHLAGQSPRQVRPLSERGVAGYRVRRPRAQRAGRPAHQPVQAR